MSVDWNTNLLPADIDTYQIKIDSERSGAALSPDSTRTLRWRKDNTAPYRDDVRASFTLSNNNRQPIKVYIYHFYPQDGQWFLDDIIVGIHNRLTPQPDPDGIVLITEKNAEPSVGRAAYNEYLAKNLRYPHKAKENKIQARVFVEFIIERDGTLSNIKAVRNVPVGYGCEEEAERLIKEGPQWLPAEQNKQKVRQRITLPITFKLE